MTDIVRELLGALHVFVLCYFVVLNSIYLLLILLAAAQCARFLRRRPFAGHDDVFANPLTPAVSVLIPAHNEAPVIIESVRSMLALRYPAFEVIVVDDGSEDDTFALLQAEFDLRPLPMVLSERTPVDGKVLSVHASGSGQPLVVIRKESVGRRADALNVALNAARNPLVCMVDADALLDPDALLQVVKPFVDDPEHVAGVGGTIRAVNGCRVEGGRVVEVRLARTWITRIQVVEYLRAFMLGRSGWSALGGLLVISGAFGVFRRDLVLEVGGMDRDSLGEDAELVARLHARLRDRHAEYRMVFLSEPVCWTQVPSTVAVLARQRRRWSQGLAEILWKHRRMIGNPRYGRIGVVVMPYFLVFEFLGPVVEVVGLVAVVVGLATGTIDTDFALLFGVVTLGYGMLLSLAAIVVEVFGFHRYLRSRDLRALIGAAVLENLGFRQAHTWWRLQGIWRALRGTHAEWGVMTRQGFATSLEAGSLIPEVRRHHRLHRSAGLGALATLGVVASIVAPSGGWSQGLYLAGVTVASLIALIILVVRRPTSAWRWISAGVALSAAADWLWAVQEWLGSAVWVWSNGVYFASYLCIATGLVQLGRTTRGAASTDRAIEVWSVTIVAALVSWSLAIEPSLDASGPVVDRAIAALYPVLDVGLFVAAIWAFAGGLRRRRATTVALAVGLLSWLGADIWYLVLAQTDSYTFGAQRLLDSAWLVGAFALAAAVVCGDADTANMSDPVLRAPSWRRLAFGSVLIVSPVIVETASDISRGETPPFAVLLSSAALAGLVLWRTSRFAHMSRASSEMLRRQRNRAEALAHNSSDATVVLSRNGTVVEASPSIRAVLGLAEDDVLGRYALDLVVAGYRDVAVDLMQRSIVAPGEVFSDEVQLHAQGRGHWFGVRCVNLLHVPDVEGIVVNLHDVNDRKEVEDELLHQAFHDSLTALANRALFSDRAEHALERLEQTDREVAVLYIDLDGFKSVNDSAGHEYGDRLLRTVADRIQELTRREDTVARLGGDEFVVLIEDTLTGGDRPRDLASRILRELAVPTIVNGEAFAVSASIGIATAGAGSDPAELLRHADLAMYHAKKQGKNRSVRFEAWMNEAFRQQLQIEHDLPGAIARGEMRLVYQPVVRLDTLQLLGFEALLRWCHPTLGDIGPDQFIPVAERTGAIVNIGAWVLATSCGAMAGWHRNFPQHGELSIAVNVSPVQLTDTAFVASVHDLLGRCDIRPGSLIIEITETALIDHPEAVRGSLDQLRSQGLRVALDDFGTGYSSLSHLQQLAVDIVKIDRSFTDTIRDNDVTPPLIFGLLDLTRSMGVEVIAEGIERTGQLDVLRRARCASGQGYLFDKPLEPSQVLERLAGSSHPLADPTPAGCRPQPG